MLKTLLLFLLVIALFLQSYRNLNDQSVDGAQVAAALGAALEEMEPAPSSSEVGATKRLLICADINMDPDDAVALSLAHGLMSEGYCQIIATVSCSQRSTAEALAGINSYFGRDHLPVGAFNEEYHLWDQPHSTPGTPLLGSYPDDLARLPHSALDGESLQVMQRALADSPDGSVTIVTLGFLTNVERLLDTVPDLIRQKVERLVVMGGHGSDSNHAENNVSFWPRSAQRVSEGWPTPITAVGVDSSGLVITGANSWKLDSRHPVRIALEAFNQSEGLPLWTGRYSPDPMAVWEAVMGNLDTSGEALWDYQTNLQIHWTGGRTYKWTIGPHRYITPPADPNAVARAIDAFAMRGISLPR